MPTDFYIKRSLLTPLDFVNLLSHSAGGAGFISQSVITMKVAQPDNLFDFSGLGIGKNGSNWANINSLK